MPSSVALIPARAGSERVPGKNIRLLGGHPLLAYAIAGARESGLFDAVILSTDSEAYAEIGRRYGAQTPFLRPREFATSASPDIEWVRHALTHLPQRYECFSILRPTSPFRTSATIRRAMAAFLADPDADSLRAVERVSQHPGKMWVMEGKHMRPLLQGEVNGTPWHSCQTSTLPEIYVQNASLEIAWARVAEAGSIAGEHVIPFLTQGHEGFDINLESHWREAERLIASGEARLPELA